MTQSTDVPSHDEAESDSKPKKSIEFTTKNAAHYLGISPREFNRRERCGIYVPTRVSAQGWKFYDIGYLAEMKAKIKQGPGRVADVYPRVIPSTAPMTRGSENLSLGRGSPSAPRTPSASSPSPSSSSAGVYSPSDAVRVFAQLKKDEDLVRIVMELDMDPAVVDAIHEQWRKLRSKSGGFQLSGETVERLNKLPLDGFPVRSQKDLELALEALASSADPCESCGVASRRQSRVCQGCYEAQQRRVLAEAVATEVASRKSVKGAGAKKS